MITYSRNSKKAKRRGYIKPCDDGLKPTDIGVLLYNHRIILPKALINRALNKALGPSHPGANALKRRIRTTFWFPQLDALCKEKVWRCKNCAMFTPKNRNNKLYGYRLDKSNVWDLF